MFAVLGLGLSVLGVSVCVFCGVGCGVWGLWFGFWVVGLGFGVLGLGFGGWRVEVLECGGTWSSVWSVGLKVESLEPPWSRVEGKSQVNLPQMPPFRGGICMEVD